MPGSYSFTSEYPAQNERFGGYGVFEGKEQSDDISEIREYDQMTGKEYRLRLLTNLSPALLYEKSCHTDFFVWQLNNDYLLEGVTFGMRGSYGYSHGCKTTLMASPLRVRAMPSLILSRGRVCVINFSVGKVGEIASWNARLDWL